METSNFSGKSSSSKIEPWELLESGQVSWEGFSSHDRNLIARRFAPKIKIIALRMKAKLPQSVEMSELMSAGALGLVEALKKFRPELGIKIDTYAESRIKGAMLDELRRLDWFSRGMRQRVRSIESAIRKIEQETGGPVRIEQLEALTGLEHKVVLEGLEAMQSQITVTLDAITENFSSDKKAHLENEPFMSMAQQDIIEKVSLLIEELTEKEKLVLSLYYADELNMKETAEVLGVTEGRVSQLHSQALSKLKQKFRVRYGGDAI